MSQSFLESIPVTQTLEMGFAVITSADLGASYQTRAHTLMERLQHLNFAELWQKTKVYG